MPLEKEQLDPDELETITMHKILETTTFFQRAVYLVSGIWFEREWFVYIFVSSVVGNKNIIITLKINSKPSGDRSPFSPTLPYGNHQSVSLPMCLLDLDILCKWIHTICGLSWLISFI